MLLVLYFDLSLVGAAMSRAQGQCMARALQGVASTSARPLINPSSRATRRIGSTERSIATSSRQQQRSAGRSSRSDGHKVAYAQEKSYASGERRSFFQDGSVHGHAGGLAERDLPPELVPGRVVECRRYVR